MLRFDSALILRKFLTGPHMTVADLAKQARVSHRTADRALSGEQITAPVVRRIAHALGVDAADYLTTPRRTTKGGETQ